MKASDLEVVNATNLDAYARHLKELVEQSKKPKKPIIIHRRASGFQPPDEAATDTGRRNHFSPTE